MNRLQDVDTVIRLIDRFYDPLIARGFSRCGGEPSGNPDDHNLDHIDSNMKAEAA